MDLREQVTALFLRNAPHEDAVAATAVEIPFYHCVSLSNPDYALSRCLVFKKKIIFQVVPDLRGPCIGTLLRIWAWLPEVFGTLEGPYLVRQMSVEFSSRVAESTRLILVKDGFGGD
jgi:hypothetical protein